MPAQIKTNCPNCGAIITGEKCQYCGTIFDVVTELDTGKYIKDKIVSIDLFDITSGKLVMSFMD
jgi:methionyl-tRNA synthetase